MTEYTETTEDRYKLLLGEYTRLKEQYNNLNNEFEKLKHETSENTVIQSMNDMKTQYDRVMQNTVPLYRFKSLEQHCEHFSQTCQAAVVLLEHSRKSISGINRFNFNEKIARKVEIETIVIKDLIQDAITNK